MLWGRRCVSQRADLLLVKCRDVTNHRTSLMKFPDLMDVTNPALFGMRPATYALRLVIFLILFCSLLACPSANAVDPGRRISQYAHTAWRVRDGVFSGAPTAITQTTDGYVWIGTLGGCCASTAFASSAGLHPPENIFPRPPSSHSWAPPTGASGLEQPLAWLSGRTGIC